VEDTGFVLIGAGLPRTGTLSTRVALQELLQGDVYHMVTLLRERPDHLPYWKKALKNECSVEDWREMMGSFRGGVDYPVSLYYQQLMEAFPNAKVLLNVRDPVKWYTSVKTSIYRANTQSTTWPCSWFFYLVGSADNMFVCRNISRSVPKDSNLGLGLFEAIEHGEDAAVQFYHDHVNQVKSVVPADRLLVWEVKEGWEPLCDFLGLPVPDHPFPRLNDTGSIENGRKTIRNVSWLMIVFLPLMVALIAYWLTWTTPWPYLGVLACYGLLVILLRGLTASAVMKDTRRKKNKED